MRQQDYLIRENAPLARGVRRLALELPAHAPPQEIPVPGRFVNLRLEGFYLRRPVSVCDWGERTLTLIYKAVGGGTEKLAAMEPGQSLDLLVGLGNGYTLFPGMQGRPLLVGGGVGAPPLYGLAKCLRALGQAPVAILGFNCVEEAFYLNEFNGICGEVLLTTVDGSAGIRGFVTDALPLLAERGTPVGALYACGPEPMLRALCDAAPPLPPGRAQFSFEQRMACGFGACMGCSRKTPQGYKRVCKDGPVLAREEILW